MKHLSFVLLLACGAPYHLSLKILADQEGVQLAAGEEKELSVTLTHYNGQESVDLQCEVFDFNSDPTPNEVTCAILPFATSGTTAKLRVKAGARAELVTVRAFATFKGDELGLDTVQVTVAPAPTEPQP